MSKVKLYIARHGKTMFNTIGRVQGWSDSPLTPFGEEGIRELGVGLKAAGIPFKSAYSSDSGRTIQTMDIILRETGLETIPYKRDKRIREWCFGSFDGGYDGEFFYDVLPRTVAFQGKNIHDVTYPELAQSILSLPRVSLMQIRLVGQNLGKFSENVLQKVLQLLQRILKGPVMVMLSSLVTV